MSKTWLLIKNYFFNYIGAFSKSKNKGSRVRYGLGAFIILFVGVMFVSLFVSMALSTMESAIKVGDPSISLYVSVGLLFMFFLLMTMSRSTSSKKNNDDDLLLSLPIKKSQIVFSKIVYNYLFDLILDMGALIPSFVVYYFYEQPPFSFLLRCLLLLLLIPMLSNAIGALIGLLFQKLVSRFKNAEKLQSIISVIFLVIFMLGYYAIQYYITTVLPTNPEFSMQSIIPLRIIVDFILGNKYHILYGVGISLICIIPFIICIVLKAHFLGVETKKYRNKNKQLDYRPISITKTLFIEEIGRYFNSSIYVMNTLFGGIILILLSTMYLVIGPKYITDKLFNEQMRVIVPYLNLIVIAMGVMITSTIAISSSSISIEGKNIWILKAHPVSVKKVFTSKILTNFVIAASCGILSGLLFGIRFIIDNGLMGLLFMIGYLIIIILYSVIISMTDLFINLLYPKMIWDNEVEVVKQSMSVGISLLVNSGIAVVIFAPYLLLFSFLDSIWYILIAIGIEIIIFIIIYLLLFKKGKKMFEKI